MGLMGLIMACYLGLYGTLNGLTKSTDHPSVHLGASGGTLNRDPGTT